MTAFLKLTNGLLTANYKLNRDMSHYRPLTAILTESRPGAGFELHIYPIFIRQRFTSIYEHACADGQLDLIGLKIVCMNKLF